MGARVDSTAAGGEAYEAMGIIFQEEQTTLETSTTAVSRGSTLEPVGSDKGLSFPSHAPSFGRDSKSSFEEERNSFLCV